MYKLIDKTEPESEIKLFETKEEVLQYLETVYWYDFDTDTTDGDYATLADYHKSMTLDEALKLYTDYDWVIE